MLCGDRAPSHPNLGHRLRVNSFLLSLTALLIVVLSALFAAPLFIDWNDYRPVFETQATKLLGRDVKVDGKVHLVLLPAPELRFDDVKVADETGSLERPFLEARSIEAWLNIGALLTGDRRGAQDRHRRSGPAPRRQGGRHRQLARRGPSRRGAALRAERGDARFRQRERRAGSRLAKEGKRATRSSRMSRASKRGLAVRTLQGVCSLTTSTTAARSCASRRASRCAADCSAQGGAARSRAQHHLLLSTAP